MKECLTVFDKKNPDCKHIADVLQRCGVVLTEVKSRDFSSKDIEQDLTRLLGKLTNNLGSYLVTTLMVQFTYNNSGSRDEACYRSSRVLN